MTATMNAQDAIAIEGRDETAQRHAEDEELSGSGEEVYARCPTCAALPERRVSLCAQRGAWEVSPTAVYATCAQPQHGSEEMARGCAENDETHGEPPEEVRTHAA